MTLTHYAHHNDQTGTNSPYHVIHAATNNHIMILLLKNAVYVHHNNHSTLLHVNVFLNHLKQQLLYVDLIKHTII